ncbi:cysteine-rich receptor-like protein kinase 8 isoform X2 [Elaeis guineensis]|uniref:cysteine-rich receptor-like protein kinase 8 isoform X2 n=1 Tax=Elaeis guineensis var. tenera TaxID=51953 RepID=UPI00057B40FC
MPSNLLTKLPQILFLSALFTTIYAPNGATQTPIYVCDTDSNYTTNSTYHSNLNLLLPSLSSATRSTGFATLSKGQPPDEVFGLALCRGDVSQDECGSCLSTADQDHLQLCPSGKSAAIWAENCFLRYSNRSFSSSSSDENSFRDPFCNLQDVSEPLRFENLVSELLNNLTERAAYHSARMFATGEAEFMNSTTLYGLVQCMREQSGDECYGCLTVSAGNIPNTCWGKQGATVLGYNCLMRFEIYRFYNESVGAAPPPPPSTDSVSPPPEASTPPVKEGGQPDIGDEEDKNVGTLLFDLSTLRTATTNFSDTNKLGDGGFGSVYKGVLPNGQEIAVKRLSAGSRQGLLEFKAEVVFLAKLQHKNLVRLLGCCLEQEERLLVYEFLHNTSLDKFLFDPMKNRLLDWRRRYNIIEGIAKGLLYLHQDSPLKIIHRDLKTNNILLDQDMNPKISDFGLAKLFDGDKTRGIASRIAGTCGYMAPEYAIHRHFSTKSDVFSFGVLVLEIVIGRRINDFQGSGHAANLLSYAWKHWNTGRALHLMDRNLGDQYDRQEASRCIHMGLLCVQEDQTKRPSMELVVLMLSSHSLTVSTPSVPAFFVQGSATPEPDLASRNRNSNPPESGNSYQYEEKSNSASINDVTISEMEPR